MDGKRVVITGATGIAAASANRLLAEGASLFVISRDEDELRALAEELDPQAKSVAWAKADLTVEEAAEEAFRRAHSHLGGIDGVLAVAGASGRRFGDGPTDQLTLDAWQDTISINLSPAFLTSRQAIRVMRDGGGGSIVCIGSVLADHPSPQLFATHAYAVSKGAIASFVRISAAHYAADHIRVNGIAPGLVRTPMAERAANDPETVRYVERKQPLAAGLLDAEAVADAALFLLSDESTQITGQVIAVDGGWGVTEVGP